MSSPSLFIDLDKIEHNGRTIVGLCQSHNIEVTGVTKVVCGDPLIAGAMLASGVASLADSRLINIRRLHKAGVKRPYLLLRVPALSTVEEVVDAVDMSLNSELPVLEGLSLASCRRGLVHAVLLMVDLGDLREGIWPDDLIPFVRQAVRLPGIRIKGLGCNLACFGGVVPTEEKMLHLIALAEELERNFSLSLPLLSGANSSGLELMASGRMPRRINHARIGEAILLGRETTKRRPWPSTFQDAFVLQAEVLELKEKPSLPIGERSEDAFGRRPVFSEQGQMLRALLNVGQEDVDIEGIRPQDARFRVLGGSSGYLVVDASAAKGAIRVGERLSFSLNYGALLRAMTSEYVEKVHLRGGQSFPATGGGR